MCSKYYSSATCTYDEPDPERHDKPLTKAWSISPCFDISGTQSVLETTYSGNLGLSHQNWVDSQSFSKHNSGASFYSADFYMSYFKLTQRSSPSLCTHIANPSSTDVDICLSWTYDGSQSSKNCKVFSTPLTSLDALKETVTSTSRISQNMFCTEDEDDSEMAGRIVAIQLSQGCIEENHSFDITNLGFTENMTSPHECRRSCQGDNNCKVWTMSEGRCYHGETKHMASYYSNSTFVIGTRMCPTCFKGFYIPQGLATNSKSDACMGCPKGYKCPQGQLLPCPANSFCGNISTVSEANYGTSSDTRCPIDRSGVGCQHHVCENSRLGKELVAMSFEDPVNFFNDVNKYNMDKVSVKQVIQNVGSDGYGEMAIQIGFTHSILPDTISNFIGNMEYQGNIIQGVAVNKNNDQCGTYDSWTSSVNIPVPNTAGIGDIVRLQDWEMHWSSNLPFSLDNWFPSVNNPITLDPASIPEADCSHTISFMAQTKISVTPLGSAQGRPFVTIYYTIADDDSILSATTDAEGNVDIEIADTSTLELTSSVTIVAANRSGFEYDVKMCPQDLASCSASNYVSFPQTITLEHLRSYTLAFVDANVLNIQGKMTTLFGVVPCASSGVIVTAIDTSVDPAIVLDYTTTEADGAFSLAVPSTTVSLRFGIAQDLISLSSSALEDERVAELLSESGYVMKETISGLSIQDTRTSTLTLDTAATACGYSIGDLDIKLTVKSCPGISFSRSASGDVDSWDVPSMEYIFDLEFANNDTDLRTAYERLYPNENYREVSLTSGDATVEMIFQPVPTLLTKVDPVKALPFSTCSRGVLPFDHIVEGNSDLSMQVTFQQNFTDKYGVTKTCTKLPEGASVIVSSRLAPEDTNVCEWGSSCSFKVETNNEDSSVTSIRTYVGEASNPGGDPSRTVYIEYGDLEKFVRSVTLALHHAVYWPSTQVVIPYTEVKFLVLGRRARTEADVISFASAVPLYYLYSPPIMRNDDGELLSASTATFTKPFSVESSFYKDVADSSESSSTISMDAGAGDSVSGSLSISSGQAHVQSNTTNKNSVVTTTTTTYTFAQTTHGSDVILYMGATADLSITSTLDYQETSCRISAVSDIGWQNKATSLTISTRDECEASLQTILKVIAIYENSSDHQSLVAEAKEERNKWLDLLRHWDTDRRNALNFPVNLTSSIQGAASGYDSDTNILSLSGALGDITFEKAAVNHTQSLVDFLTFSTSDSTTSSSSMGISLGDFSVSQDTSQTYTQTYTVDNNVYSAIGNENTISTTLASGEGNSLCLQIFESPFSGSFVYHVCGGQTRCPHILGTDAREQFFLEENLEDSLPMTLDTDSGSFSFYINLTPMQEEDLELDLDISVDVASATGYVTYQIAGSPVNKDLTLSVSKSTASNSGRHLVAVQYERLDPKLLSTMVTITVTSACDDAISDSLPFTLNWEQSCPKPQWAGSLTNANATWVSTESTPTVKVAYTSGSPSTGEVTLWAAPYNPVSGTPEKDEFVQVGVLSGTELDFVPEKAGLNANSQYLIELRSNCGARSDPRLGIFDNAGPTVIGWAPIKNVTAAMASQSISVFRFSEPIDCSATELDVRVSTIDSKEYAPTSFTCSSTLYDLDVVLHLNTSDLISQWSEKVVLIHMHGLQDLYGNKRSDFETVVSIPSIKSRAESSSIEGLPSWRLAETEDLGNYVSQVRSSKLSPSVYFTTVQYASDEDSSNNGKTKVIAAVLSVLAVVGVAVAGTILYLRRQQGQVLSTNFRVSARKSSENSVVAHTSLHMDNSNPRFEEGAV